MKTIGLYITIILICLVLDNYFFQSKLHIRFYGIDKNDIRIEKCGEFEKDKVIYNRGKIYSIPTAPFGTNLYVFYRDSLFNGVGIITHYAKEEGYDCYFHLYKTSRGVLCKFKTKGTEDDEEYEFYIDKSIKEFNKTEMCR